MKKKVNERKGKPEFGVNGIATEKQDQRQIGKVNLTSVKIPLTCASCAHPVR
jgi:hypothetical protein